MCLLPCNATNLARRPLVACAINADVCSTRRARRAVSVRAMSCFIRPFLSTLRARVAHRCVARAAPWHERGAVPAIRAEHLVAGSAHLRSWQVQPLHGRPAYWHILHLRIDCITLCTRRGDAVVTIVFGAAGPDAMAATVLTKHDVAARASWGAATAVVLKVVSRI